MLLSIVIPSYNHEQFVLRTIQAAALVDIQDKEIIVIDDGSSDDSPRLIREYIDTRANGTNIRLIARENRGLVRTLNEGLSISRGKYFYVVASDDIPIPKGIESLFNILQNNDRMQFALGNALFMESEQQCEFKVTYGESHRRFFSLPYEERQKQMFLSYPQPLLLQATVFRTSALNAMGGWREDIVVDDFSLFLRMLPRLQDVGKDFGYYPEIAACFYRQHGTNSHRNLERQFSMVEQALAQLCPLQWRDAALFKNFAFFTLVALRRRQLTLAARFVRSTVRHVGVVGLMQVAPSVLRRALVDRISGNHIRSAGCLIAHEPAVPTMAHSSSEVF